MTSGVVRRLAPLFLAGALATSWVAELVRGIRVRLGDADVWWVAAAGRDMLATGRIPRTNGWSFVEPDRPWVMHEWLFGPPYAWGLQALGPRFFALAGACAFILTGAIIAGATLGRARHAAAGCLAAFVALVLFAHPTARPTWVAVVFLAAMASLAFRERMSRRAAIACVLLELVWTNAHGSFPLGVLLLLAGAFASTTDRQARLAATAAAALVTLINPYGLRLHALVLQYALGEHAGVGDLERIVEYLPLWDPRYFTFVPPGAAIGLAGVLLVSVVTLARGRHRARACLVLLLAPLAVLHARNASIVAIVGAVVLVPALDELVERTRLASFAGGPLRVGKGALVGVAAGVLATAGVAFATVASRPEGAWIDPEQGGASFLRLADRIPDGGNTVTPFRSAGLLLWRASQRGVRVFYDSRNDCYSPEMRHLGLTLHGMPGDAALAQLDARGARYALIPSPPLVPASQRIGLDGALSAAGDWTLVERDGVWGLYSRTRPPWETTSGPGEAR